MDALALDTHDARAVGAFVTELKSADQAQRDAVLNAHVQHPSVLTRFLSGAYSHPLTWWIGIIQLQMQSGVWGHRHQAAAVLRANSLGRLIGPLRREVASEVQGEGSHVLRALARYNLSHRKADMAGRFAGGLFTSYASTGGAAGNRRLGTGVKLGRMGVNFLLASYGAAVKAVGEGYTVLPPVLQAIMIGQPRPLPCDVTASFGELTAEESEAVASVSDLLPRVYELTQVATGPVPVAEFCARPENRALRGICR